MKAVIESTLIVLLFVTSTVVVLFLLAFIFTSVSKLKPETKCIIEFSDGLKRQASNCDIYRDSTNLDCNEINYSMYAVKSWECK
jgi:hypothetical protein